MASVKTRVALTGGKYLLTHPRSRLTRFVVRFAARKLRSRIATATRVEAIPATRGSRLTTVLGVAVVAGAVVIVVRRAARRPEPAPSVTVPPPYAPVAPAATSRPAAPEPREAPPAAAATSPAAEAAASVEAAANLAAAATDVGEGDDAVVARVQAKLFGGTPPLGVSVEAHAGVVTLRGTVADQDAETRFVRDAEQIEGVKAVQSELQTAGAEPGDAGS